MNKIIITVQVGTQTSEREYNLDTVLEKGTDLNEQAADMLETIKNSYV